MWEQPKRLYVAEFRTGVLKVGVTGMPGDRRIYGLQQKYGLIHRVHYGPPHECGFWAERQLLQRMRRLGVAYRGREWFCGVRFGAARQLVNQVTRMAHAMQSRVAPTQAEQHPFVTPT